MDIKTIPTQLKKTLETRGIKDTPAFPLALNVTMPEDYGVDHANLTFRFFNLACSCPGAVRAVEEKADNPSYKKLTLSLEQVQIAGQYAIEAVEAPKVDLDLGGTLMPYDSVFNKPRPAGADQGSGIFNDQQKNEYLDQAREQRTRLMDTPNGQKLMGVYDGHEEVYTEMFQNSNAVRTTWQQGNVTADMASHTSDAIKNDTTVNPPPEDKMFGEGFYQMGYNNNALVQQVTLATACMAAAKKTDNLAADADLPDNKYSQAALAASQFKQLVADTGNTQDQTKAMTSSEVYTTVDSHSGDVPKMTLAELNNMQSQSKGSGGGAAAVAEARENGWYILSEQERSQMRTIMDRCYAEFCEYDERKPQPLWQGACSASIPGVEVSVLIGKASNEVIVEAVELPVFDFELDDSGWEGEAGAIARERLSQIHFVRSLIHEQVTKCLELATLDIVKH
ncbi:hypothetical protein [Endozoicomonas sp. Mp262]|uniref:hypothetical protein n=1 Tax=Endozoicomonas sp. Mp262 TaxID=2919499 RepID=UPI0021DADC44